MGKRGKKEGKRGEGTSCPFAGERDQLGIVCHACIRLFFVWERAGEDAFKDGVLDFVRVGGGADFAHAVDPPLPLIRPSLPDKSRATSQGGGEEDRKWNPPSASRSSPSSSGSSTPTATSACYSPTSSQSESAQIHASVQNTYPSS